MRAEQRAMLEQARRERRTRARPSPVAPDAMVGCFRPLARWKITSLDFSPEMLRDLQSATRAR